jgi:hypothetical protein
MKRLLGVAVLASAVTSCVTAYVYKPDVVGPNGEHLVELACSTPDACMDFARKTCSGDFEIVTSSDVTGGGGKTGVSSTDLMLIHCKNGAVAVPAPPTGVEAPAR